jgi:Protein of unknown function (DUF402)
VPADRFAPGEIVVRRDWQQDRICFVQLARVIADDEDGLRLWVSAGSSYWRILAPDGRTLHDASIDELGEQAYLGELTWSGTDVMLWMPPHPAHYSIWWFFDAASGEFHHWYVNLETPIRRWAAGVDSSDNALDVRGYPDGRWEWKDEDEFERLTGHPGHWTVDEAREIRAEGERLIKKIEAAEFPFDGTWCDLRRDALGFDSLPARELPPGWDGPRAL